MLRFEKLQLRVHFLMFGSYRINNPRENRIPKLELSIGKSKIYFYSCAIKEIDGAWDEIYDWSIDVMSETSLRTKFFSISSSILKSALKA